MYLFSFSLFRGKERRRGRVRSNKRKRSSSIVCLFVSVFVKYIVIIFRSQGLILFRMLISLNPFSSVESSSFSFLYSQRRIAISCRFVCEIESCENVA